jgi:hypothetical protein
MPTAPTPVDALPTAPNPDSPEATFDSAAYAWSAALPAWTTAVNAVGGNVFANATEANAAANTAAAAQTAAANSALAAAGAANFKGEWSALTGALARPACVKHSGRFWLLLSDLGDVTTATPGVSAAWTSMDAGTRPTQLITGNTSAVAGVCYLIGANSITLTAPTGQLKGDYFGFRLLSGITGAVVEFGSTKLMGGTPGTLEMDVPNLSVDLFFEDATRGYV